MNPEELNAARHRRQSPLRHRQGGYPDRNRQWQGAGLISCTRARFSPSVAGEPEDLLFVSEHAITSPARPSRGHRCWPWFDPIPGAGGRRTDSAQPRVAGARICRMTDASVRLGITPDEEIRALWPHLFG
jgi:hypothetical protein